MVNCFPRVREARPWAVGSNRFAVRIAHVSFRDRMRDSHFFAPNSFAETFIALYGCSAIIYTSPLRASQTPRITYFVVVTSPNLANPPWNGSGLPSLPVNSVKLGLLTDTGPWWRVALSPGR